MRHIKLTKPSIDTKELKIISKSIKSGWLTHGKYNQLFEKKFTKLIKSNYSVSMNSCTSALECALKIIKQKGEVIIPSWTWVSTCNAVLNTGNIPVFVDVDINSRNITAEEILKKINKKTIAVIVVHYAGLPCEMDKIVDLTKRKKIFLIEDSAETLGGTYKGKMSGSFGVGCFSFFPTKNITTCEGGMITLKSFKHYDYVKKLIAHGIDNKLKKNKWNREAILPGHNFRLPNHLAALGLSQLKKLKKFNAKRRKIAKKYNVFFEKNSYFFEIQKFTKDFTHSYQMYSVLTKNLNRNEFVNYLNKNGIEASVHFDPPLHRQKYLKKFYKYKLPNTDFLTKHLVTLPIYPELKKVELDYVFNVITKYLQKGKK